MFDVTELSAQDTIGGVYSLAFFFSFFVFSETIKLGISCELSAKQTIHMKCQALFYLRSFSPFR